MRADGLLALVLCLGLCPPAVAQSVRDAGAPYDRMLEEARTRFHLPGIALGVIEDGRIVYRRGAGETVAGSGIPVTPSTLFEIGSNSKAMTTALLGRLAAQGRLRWSDPVTRHLPEFRMHDPWVTAQMRVGDLLTHSSGLPEGGGDLMLWPAPNAYTRTDILHALRYLKPAYGFRSEYRYDNLLYVVAGEVAAAAGGAPYEVLLRREVLQPLGLDRCQVGAWNRVTVGNVALPHRREGDRNIAIEPEDPQVPASTSAAAGGVSCDLDAMLRWARNWLDPTPAELAWLPEEQRRILQSPHMPIPVGAFERRFNRTHVFAYGYGWRMADVDGQWVVWHTGTLDGMYSMLALLPDRRSGYVFLINGEAEQARKALGQALLKHFTDPDDTRGVAGWAALQASATGARPSHAPDTASSVPVDRAEVEGLLGRYVDPWLGEARLCAEDGAVRFAVAKSPRLSGRLRRLGARLFVVWDSPGVGTDAWLDPVPPSSGQATQLRLSKLDPEADFSADFEDLHFGRTGDCTGPARPSAP